MVVKYGCVLNRERPRYGSINQVSFVYKMNNHTSKNFIFLAGLHRSGTSLLHEIIKGHARISGFENTGVPEDEGQHLQTVYNPGIVYGGAGKFAFNTESHMDETHELATESSAQELMRQWSNYYDMDCEYLVEKSPPNIVRLRFLQKLFPQSKFVVILRHPIAVSYATQKWSKTSIPSLIDHTLVAYEKFLADMKYIDSLFVLRYEEFVQNPQDKLDEIFDFIGMDSVKVNQTVNADVNEKYFNTWEKNRASFVHRIFNRIPASYEPRAKQCGYSLANYRELQAVDWLGIKKIELQS